MSGEADRGPCEHGRLAYERPVVGLEIGTKLVACCVECGKVGTVIVLGDDGPYDIDADGIGVRL